MDTFKDKVIFSFLEYKRGILAGLFCCAGFCALAVHFLTQPGSESYAEAEAAYQIWKEQEDDASYIQMRKALQKVPTLENKYRGAIAQKLFYKKRLPEALELAQESIKGLDEAPYHAAYAGMSILIEKGEYQKALEQSVTLRETMLKKCDLQQEVGGHSASGGLLYAHNLLRIACLQQELHNIPGEKAAWAELEDFLEGSNTLKRLVFENFRDKWLNLGDFIAERKKQL